ncbi:orotidine 5'-phosphate decarboxylase [Agyrium rufum]|nr:orotidine 5'-phosphate decarboxylase [Agyrium rufum]
MHMSDIELRLNSSLGPYIAVFKTHIDIVEDFDRSTTIKGLQALAAKHNFLVFEDRKFVDIGNTIQKQYHGGALRISEWAHIVNASVLAGDGIVEALTKTGTDDEFPYVGDRALLILAEMTTKGSLAVGEYTKASIESARKHSQFVIGERIHDGEDFVVFTTGVNRATKGDSLGQQYQTSEMAIKQGADFIITGRGIYAAEDPVEMVKLYQKEGWDAYLARTSQAEA